MGFMRFLLNLIILIYSVFLCSSIEDRNRNCLEFNPEPPPGCRSCSKCYPGSYDTPGSCGFCRQCNMCIERSDCSCSRGCYSSYWGDRCQYKCTNGCKRCSQTNGSECVDPRYPWHQLDMSHLCYEFTSTGMCGACDRCFEDMYPTQCGFCKPCQHGKKGPRYINNCTCGEGCIGPFWGERCEHQCSDRNCPKCDQKSGTICHHESLCPNCIDNACIVSSQHCVRGCKNGFTGPKCDQCSPSCRDNRCDLNTGRCLNGCAIGGFHGELCTIPIVGGGFGW